jgi:hypothetical protein
VYINLDKLKNIYKLNNDNVILCTNENLYKYFSSTTIFLGKLKYNMVDIIGIMCLSSLFIIFNNIINTVIFIL